METLGFIFGMMGFTFGMFGLIGYTKIVAIEKKLKETGILDKKFSSD